MKSARIIVFAFALFLSAFAYANLVQIKLNGVPQKIEKIVANSTSISKLKASKNNTPKRVRLIYDRSIQQVKNALAAYGYFRAQVTGTLTYNTDQKNWLANYQVTLGKPLRIQITNIVIEGAGKNDKAFKRIIKRSGVAVGDILVQSKFKNLASNLTNKALVQGYFDAKMTKREMRIDLMQYFAIVDITFKTGKRYHFEETTFTQKNYKFDVNFLKRYLNFKPGQPYSLRKIQALQSTLGSSDYFSSVSVTPNPTINDIKKQLVPVSVKLTAKKPQQYTVGLGYGTETGPRITLGANYRYVNTHGSHLSFNAQISKVYQQITTAYIIPGDNPQTDYTSLNAGQNHTNIQPYSANSTLIGFDISKKINDWQRTLSLHQNFVRYLTDSRQSGKASYVIPQFNLLYQHRKRTHRWYDGFSIDWTAEGAVKKLLSDANFVKSIVTGKFSINLNRNSRFFFLASAGGIATNHIDELSPTIRFYTGGINGVRGYRYKSLSPFDSNGKETGGRYLLTGSANFEHYLFHQISGIVFFDKGNAFNSFNDLKLFSGAGVGFSYHSPVGPIRLYFSHPINEPNSRWRIDFTIGSFL